MIFSKGDLVRHLVHGWVGEVTRVNRYGDVEVLWRGTCVPLWAIDVEVVPLGTE